MNKKFYLTLLLFVPFFVFGQNNYQPGVVVNLKGDTVRGFINYKQWTKNPESIDFKSQQNGKVRELGLKEIQYFGVFGYEYYRRYTVGVSLSNTDVSQLSTTPDTTTKTSTVFLKILQTGKRVTLFSYADDLKTRFYIKIKSSSQPEELRYLLYLNSDNGVVSRKIYQGQLSVIVADSHLNLADDIEKTNYSESSLTNIVSKINDGSSTLSVQNKQSSIRFFAGVAGSGNSLNFTSSGSQFIHGSTTAFSPQLDFGLDFHLNPGVGSWILRIEMSASLTNYSVAQATVSTYYAQTVSEQLDQLDLAISPMIIYNFYNTAKLKVYAGVGLKGNLPSYSKNIYTTVSKTGGSSNTTDFNTSQLEMESLYLSVPIKAGIIINKSFEIYLGYYTPATLTNYLTTGKVTSYQAGFNYFFGK